MMLGLERWNGGWDGLCAPGGQVETAAADQGAICKTQGCKYKYSDHDY